MSHPTSEIARIKNPYIPIVLSIVPRILSHLDRDPQSPTYGCFDRAHWLLKIRPFSSGALQQSCLPLAIVYTYNFEGNIYYKNESIRRWSIASIKFWQKIQNKNGTVDEYFKREGSFPSTAFATCGVSETYKLFKLEDELILKSLTASCIYLSKRVERFAVNQEIAAIYAIYNLYLLTKKEKFLDMSSKRIENLKKIQSKEGLFREHGGADIGYLTVSLDYLASLYEITKGQDIKNMCDKVANYISYFIHPDGTLGGIYGSRNTEYFCPAGFEILSKDNALASTIINKLLSNIIQKEHLNLSVDDRYLLYFVGSSFAKALLAYKQSKKLVKLPYRKKFDILFKESRIYIVSRKNFYLIISLKKGGCFKLYYNKKLLMNDLGYKIIENDKVHCSEFENNSEDYKITDNKIEIRKNFSKRGYFVLQPIHSFLIHLYALIFKDTLWNFFRMLFIKRNKKSGYLMDRTFTLDKDRLVIDDIIYVDRPVQLIKCNNQSIKIIPSSKFFQLSELSDKFVSFSRFIEKPTEIKTEVDLTNLTVKTYVES